MWKAVAIPVFANGNIQSLQDVERCIQDTGVQGVTSTEGNLDNPALFEGRSPAVWKLAEEYLDIVRGAGQSEDPGGHCRPEQGAEDAVSGGDIQEKGAKPAGDLPFHWICHPYVQPGPREGSKEKAGGHSKWSLEEEECGMKVLSKNKQKQQLRNPHKTFDPSLKPKYAKCDQCGNPKGNRCVFSLCRGCCKRRATKETADCPGHGLLFKTKLEKSLAWKGTQPELQEPQMATPHTPGGFSEVMSSALA
ncbi:tRNA-dihydrouridine(16/17) synthase [NAD(P)(+)]-like protein [Saguinus oedipus]|uniref:tRNA-dihydrouridine(16/17) synthase [NAD(P)(+)]-like protein n=1 Tax=Saguinus oedipus TaxID=9490 RepID=A0ABQ9VES5_SAGOE|nr:tRNA-dihydrouridine(16/17) synthase [NAD(P)(+)]-like protein [Saguinus oedipus]